MGNGLVKLKLCFAGDCEESSRRRKDVAAVDLSDTLDEGLGHSFVYMKPDTSSGTHLFSNDSCSSTTTTTASSMTTAFYTISGASISANTSTPLSTALFDLGIEKASAFESSQLFSSIPLQPVPRSGPVHRVSGSGSGSISGGFLSAPIPEKLYDQVLHRHKSKSRKWNFLRGLKKIIPIDFKEKETKNCHGIDTATSQTGEEDDGDVGMASVSFRGENVQWAQGKAGEDRVHVVISEEHDLVFVGIYDGFNGPDATDFLLQNLYTNVFRELKGQSADVLNAMAEGLRKTEADYLNITDLMLNENPELALMGSCVLAMLMKGQDVFLMNVGDSRAVLARIPHDEHECHGNGRPWASHDSDTLYKTMSDLKHNLASHQLTVDHSTSSEEEVKRIKREHPNDSSAIKNDRVKGSLKVTRAFGAAYLKHRKWNDAVLEAFRVEYKGNNSPYINCTPSLHHHKLCPKDKFLILSSDGLYQYFTNSEAVSEVETFMSIFPDGDPAQHLIEEVVFRAAKLAGMDFHELLDIPQGQRRMYHDDVSIIVISFEGKLWQSSM